MTESGDAVTSTVVGSAAGTPRLLILAGVHGDEPESMEAVRRLAAVLPGLPLRGCVTLVAAANPTACAAGSRCGADGLDMARTFPGRADGSPTQRAAHAVTGMIRAADFMIDLHTGGRAYRVAPLSGYTLHADLAIRAAQRRMAEVFGLPVIWATTPTLEGRSLSAARDLRVPGIYAEHGGGGGCEAAGVDAYVEGCLNVMRHLEMLADRGCQPPRHPPLLVEDDRPDSGHMQVCHPAAADGLFTPAVAVGSSVRAGDLLGTVAGSDGGPMHEVRAAHAGLVLVLRVETRVRAGDGLAVLVECDAREHGT